MVRFLMVFLPLTAVLCFVAMIWNFMLGNYWATALMAFCIGLNVYNFNVVRQ